MRLVLAAIVLTAAFPAWADGAGQCRGYGDLKDRPDLAMARIVGTAERVSFVRDAEGSNGCPNTTDACRDRAYLVPGNQVIAGVVSKGFTCVDYVGAKGDDRAGWVPSASVERQSAPPIDGADWIGTWTRTEATVTIKSAGGGRLKLSGDATYGALDPDRVKRGAINTGEFEADTMAGGANLAFDVADQRTLPVDKGDEGDSKMWTRRLGPYLLVDDNNACGGLNVTFRGIYMLKP